MKTHPVRCSGCKTVIAYGDERYVLRHKIVCSEFCANEPPVTDNEQRLDEWYYLRYDLAMSPVKIGKHLYEVAHSQVYKSTSDGIR